MIQIVIIKFRYNTRADWLKKRARTYRCTESRCHAISPMVKCWSSLSFFFFDPDLLFNLENELFASMDTDHPVRNSTNNTVIESEVSEEVTMKTQSQVERYKQTEICKHVNLGN